MAWTLADARQYCRDYDWQDGSTEGQRRADRLINDAMRAMRRAAEWPFDRRIARLLFKAQKIAGTVEIDAGDTTVYGTGTAFAATDVGSYMRFNGEEQYYRVTAWAAADEIEIEAYQGPANLVGVAYTLTNERVPLPAGFRRMEKPVLQYGVAPNCRLLPAEMDDLLGWHLWQPSIEAPQYYAIRHSGATVDPIAYLWVYPAPADQILVMVPYWVDQWDADTPAHTFGFPGDPAANSKAAEVHRQYIRAGLYLAAKDGAAWQAQLVVAEAAARSAAAGMQTRRELLGPREWSAAREDSDGGVPVVTFANGEPIYSG